MLNIHETRTREADVSRHLISSTAHADRHPNRFYAYVNKSRTFVVLVLELELSEGVTVKGRLDHERTK